MANATVTAHVHNGKVVLDAPSDFPEGAAVKVHLELADPGDDLTDEERTELHAALRKSIRQLENGEGIDGEIVMAELRARLTSA